MSTLDDPKTSEDILAQFRAYKKLYESLAPADPWHRPWEREDQYIFPPRLALELAQEAQITQPAYFTTRHRKGQKLWIGVKSLIYKCLRPFFKVGLVHQQNFNHLTVVLAHSVVALEARVKELDQKLQAGSLPASLSPSLPSSLSTSSSRL